MQGFHLCPYDYLIKFRQFLGQWFNLFSTFMFMFSYKRITFTYPVTTDIVVWMIMFVQELS